LDRVQKTIFVVAMVIVVIPFGALMYAFLTNDDTLVFWSVIGIFLAVFVEPIAMSMIRKRSTKS